MIKLARIKILLPNTAVLFGVIPHSTILIKIADNAIPLTTIVSNDNITSMLISIFVLFTGMKVVSACLLGLIAKEENLPTSEDIETEILSTDHVESVHSITVSKVDGQFAVGAHIVLKHHCTIDSHDQSCREQVETVLSRTFGISQCVLQIESHQCPEH